MGKRPEISSGFTKDLWMAKKLMKICLTSLIIRKTQVKTTMKYYYSSIRMAKIKQMDHTTCGKHVEELELSKTLGKNEDDTITFKKQFGK